MALFAFVHALRESDLGSFTPTSGFVTPSSLSSARLSLKNHKVQQDWVGWRSTNDAWKLLLVMFLLIRNHSLRSASNHELERPQPTGNGPWTLPAKPLSKEAKIQNLGGKGGGQNVGSFFGILGKWVATIPKVRGEGGEVLFRGGLSMSMLG